jgi:hypothetical protein
MPTSIDPKIPGECYDCPGLLQGLCPREKKFVLGEDEVFCPEKKNFRQITLAEKLTSEIFEAPY